MWSTQPRRIWSGAQHGGRIAMLAFILLGLLANLVVPISGVGAAGEPGSVLAWGDNRSRQLGLGATGVERAAPGTITAATDENVVTIAAGGAFSLVIKADGTVLSWGSNFPSGQLGQNSTADWLDPGPVQGIGGATAIAAGRTHALAIAGGTVFAWGSNLYGQVGTATSTNCNSGTCSRVAIQVAGLSNMTAVAAGALHSLAVKGDGSVYAWGSGSYGRLGDGATAQRNTPVQVQGVGGAGFLGNIVAVAGGEGHSLALASDGTVYAWGQNTQGQLGLGAADTNNHPTPVQVPGLTNIKAIAAGYRHSLALANDGTVYAWGYNEAGQLGNGTISDNTCDCVGTPAQVGGLGGVVAIGAGEGHSMAVLNDGTVRAWGSNSSKQIGVGAPEAIPTPTQVPGLTHAVGVAGGSAHSVVRQVAPKFPLTVRTEGTGTGTVTPNGGSYNAGAQVTLQAGGTNGGVFTGWTLDGAFAGWQPTLVVTMDRAHEVVATFGQVPNFCDVNQADPYFEAIRQLSARGIIRGFEREDGQLCFAPDEGTKRAQMAALIARPLGWDLEDHNNTFSDRNGVDDNLWRNVGTLAHYNVARGYKPETCVALGYAPPCYGPTDDVLYAQVISFITRGMVEKGYWQYQADNAALYPNIPGDSGHRVDIATYLHYVGGTLPGTGSTTQEWADWAQPANRAWFAEAEWRALNSFFGLQ